jgi:uncharacterized membrane protein YhaH (DUF805 family)
MTETSFALSLIILLLIFLMRFKITEFLNENLKVNFKFQSEWVVYFITITFMVVVIVGMLLDDTKNKYGEVSEGFKNLKPKQDTRPNPLFDINTYW